MKTKVKNILRPIIFFIILIILLDLIALFLAPDGSIFGESAGVENEPENTLEYVLIGDSECYMSVSPMQIWEIYGYTGYNCGVSAQYLYDASKSLDKIYTKQKPKVILIETNMFFRKSSFLESTQKKQSRVFDTLFPLYRFHNKWKTRFKLEKSDADPLKGMRYNSTVKGLSAKPEISKTDKIYEIKDKQLNYIDTMLKKCKENGTDVVFFSAPSPVCWNYSKHNGIQKIADERNITYIDFNLLSDELGINWSTDTKDRGNHVNFYGTQKITKYVGAYLNKNYDLTDNRKNENYKSWNEAHEKYVSMTKSDKLENLYV